MNKSMLAVALSVGTLLGANSAMAADGTITFTGEVTAETCQIGGGDNPGTPGVVEVEMGSLGKESFVSNVPIAGRDFTLKLAGAAGGCVANGKVGHVSFAAADITTGGNIKNAGADAAAGVEVRLSVAGTPLNLTNQTIDFPTSTVGDEEVVVRAELIAPNAAAVAEGDINAVGNFTLVFN